MRDVSRLAKEAAKIAAEVEALRPARRVWVWPRIRLPGAGPVLVTEEEADRPRLWIPREDEPEIPILPGLGIAAGQEPTLAGVRPYRGFASLVREWSRKAQGGLPVAGDSAGHQFIWPPPPGKA